ncbi:MAG: hypothetical protein WD116_04230, partial [Chloroflexota bacterium]
IWQDADLLAHLADTRGAARLVVEGSGASETETVGRAEALAAVGATQTVADWIHADPRLLIFGRAVVAPDLASLLRGWRGLPPGWCAVTADGDMADGRGLVTVQGRADEGGEGSRQQVRRRELAATIARLEDQQAEAAQLAARELVRLGEARRAWDAAVAAHAEARQTTTAARSAFDREGQAGARARDLEALLRDELGQEAIATAASTPAAGGEASIGTSMETLVAAAADADRHRDQAAGIHDLARVAWDEARAALSAAESPEGRRRDERVVAAARRDQLSASLVADRQALTAIEAEQAAADAASASASAADETTAAERVAAEAQRDRLRAELLEHERTRGGGAARLADLEHEAQAAAIEAQRREDALAAIGRERDLALESLPVEGQDVSADPAGEAAEAGLAATGGQEIEDELRRVRRTLSQLGSVNPFAIEEHRELGTRLEALTSQDADLGTAIASTQQLIARLDTEIESRFNVAFAAIAEKFDEFCRLLFAGGSASLQMGDEADGDAAGGIEIAVRPPGKRLQRLAMLSGGERALAGVALLFAMLSVNPVPFCILDEVDAALDEANIGRFAEALRKLAETIDFVVITHNRATIEIADTIYGVTMTDAAVSRLISLRLADLPAEVAVG